MLFRSAHSSPLNLHWGDFLVRSFSRKNWFPLLLKWSSYSSQNLPCCSWAATVADFHLLDTRDPTQYTFMRFPKRCLIVTSPRNCSAFRMYLRKPDTFGPGLGPATKGGPRYSPLSTFLRYQAKFEGVRCVQTCCCLGLPCTIGRSLLAVSYNDPPP